MARDRGAGIAPAALWFGLFGGIISWAAAFTASYPLGAASCGAGAGLALRIVILGTGLIAIAAAGTAVRNWRIVSSRDEEAAGDEAGQERFFAFGGLLLSGVAVLLLIAHALPLFIIGDCT